MLMLHKKLFFFPEKVRNQASTWPHSSSAPVNDKFKSFSAKCLQVKKQASICKKKRRQIAKRKKAICLVNGQWRHQANMRRGDSREWSPLRDLLYSQPGSCLHASGQPSDGWRDELGEGDRWGGGWAWITGKQRDVKMEGKIRVNGSGGGGGTRKHATLWDLLLKSSTTAAFPPMEVWLTHAENGRALVSHWRLLRDNAGF